VSNFYRYFKENMAGLGLPAPETLFGTVRATVGSASALMAQIDKFGARVTVRELIVAGTRLEGLATIGACSAAFYAGAVVGSLAVALGRSLAGGTSLADVLMIARRYRLARPWLAANLMRLPGVYDRRLASRSACRSLATVV
jgi:hypothetical protein